MTDPASGTIPATREKKWVFVVPSKGVSTEADNRIEPVFNQKSPTVLSPTLSNTTVISGGITAAALGRDYFQGKFTDFSRTPVSTARDLIVRPKQLPPGIRNIVNKNNPYLNFRKGALAPVYLMKTLGRASVLASTVIFARSIYADITNAEDLDRKIQITQDNSGNLNSTLVINNSGYISGDYKAINVNFKINKDGKVLVARSSKASEAYNEAEAKRLSIISSEQDHAEEIDNENSQKHQALDLLKEIVTLSRQSGDNQAIKHLENFVSKISEKEYTNKQLETLNGIKSLLGIETGSKHASSANAGSQTSNEQDSVKTIIDKQTDLFIKDALAQAQKKGILTPENLERNSKNKLNYLKDTARIVNPNLTQAQLNSIKID
jgi:hypothetical protein